MKLYTLRNKKDGCLVEIYANTNEGSGWCVTISYSFYNRGQYITSGYWFVSTREIAEEALSKSTDWYNASFETPEHSDSFNKKDYEVIEINID